MRFCLILLLAACSKGTVDTPADTPDDTVDTTVDTPSDTGGFDPPDSVSPGETGLDDPHDDTGDTASTSDPGASSLVGSWVSEGDDVSALQVAAGVTRAEATFNADGTYMGFHANPTGDVTFIGSWFLNNASDPYDLTIVVTSPEVAALNGVATVSGGALQLDLVQTTPYTGETEATPAGGVGSSSLGADNVETYR